MPKDEVLAEFNIDFADPMSEKSGEYLYDHVLRRAKRLIVEDYTGVIEVLRYWLSLRKEPHTMLAVRVARDLVVTELKPELENLRQDIESGKTFLPYYKRWVDQALAAIN